MYLAIIVLPLLGSIISGFFGRKVGVNGAQFLSSICVVITTLLAVVIFVEVAFNNISVSLSLFRWVDVELLNVYWGFNFDSLTVSMLIPVLIISSLVHIYSIGYMSHDPHNQRFFSYLSLFTFMMVILVTANNFLLMFVGWEGVGVCSYLLVNFWFTRIAANQSSLSAFLTNRVGDCFLTIGMIIILLTFGNLDYSTVFSLAPFVSEDSITLIGVCLLIGAMAKSSQFGLHVWLPLAMEGPTPVSALIHAATMVTAGVYLLMRTSPLIEYSSTVLLTCLWIGSVTTVFSSLIGLFQQDIKKVIAYSTMSQLGMMVIAVGLSCYNVALFHLINHAFYKGLLFLGAGAVIHSIADNQDFRRYGGFIIFLPLSYTVMLIASLSLVAFPFMTGFYSKDFILESSFAQYTYSGTAVYSTALIGAMFTTLYSVKVLYLTFIAGASAPVVNYNNAHESNIYMSLPLIILALFSVFFGFLTKDAFIGLGSGLFTDNSLFIHPLHETAINSEFGVPHIFKLLPFILTMVITVISLIVLEFYPEFLLSLTFTRIGYNIFNFLNLKFLIEYIYNKYIAYFVLYTGNHTIKILDKGSIEKIGPYGLERILIILSKNLNTLSTGVVTTYALYILIGFVLYVSLPYILIDSHILILLIYCSILFTIKFDKQTTRYFNNTNNTNPYIVKADLIGAFCVVGTIMGTFSGTIYVLYKYTVPAFNNLNKIVNMSANNTSINEYNNLPYKISVDCDILDKNINEFNKTVNKLTADKKINDYSLDQMAENLNKYICEKFSYFTNVKETDVNITDVKITDIKANDYNLDQIAGNLKYINQDFTNLLEYLTSLQFAYHIGMVGALVVALYMLYRTRLCYDFYYHDLNHAAIYDYNGIAIPFTNINLFRYHYSRFTQAFIPPPFDTQGNDISSFEQQQHIIRTFANSEDIRRHTLILYEDVITTNCIVFDTMRVDRFLDQFLTQGFDATSLTISSEYLLRLLGFYEPVPNPWIVEWIYNYSGAFY